MIVTVICPCGSDKIENKDTGKCGKCSRTDRVVPKEKKSYTIPKVSAKRLLNPPPPKPKTAINYFSVKGKIKHDAILKVKKEIRDSAKDSNTYFCQGCLRTDKKLDNSHILSIKQRSDLATDKDNINLFCRECHEDFESGNIERMTKSPTFLKDMRYIYEHDTSRFHDILFKMIDYDGPIQKVKILLSKIETQSQFQE